MGNERGYRSSPAVHRLLTRSPEHSSHRRSARRPREGVKPAQHHTDERYMVDRSEQRQDVSPLCAFPSAAALAGRVPLLVPLSICDPACPLCLHAWFVNRATPLHTHKAIALPSDVPSRR